jgi:hypothetical protein
MEDARCRKKTLIGRRDMTTTRFDTTIKALKEGAKAFTVEKAVANIEGWEEYLSKHQHAGVKSVVTDLGKLKKMLQAESLDGGKDTVAVAGDDDNATSEKIHEIGKLLSAA